MVDKQKTLREMALFAGAGGGILGGHLLGWRTVCAVEWDSYAACVLAARQNDQILPPFPIWDDVQTFDGTKWRGLVDVVSGGFPCTDISAAGLGAGITGKQSGMWKHMARIIDEVRPRFAFVENSPLLISRGAAMVIGDLTEMGYDCEWCIVSASDVGAPHKRDRFWLKAKQRRFFSYSEHHGDGWRQQQSESIEEANRKITNATIDRLSKQANECLLEDEGRGELQSSEPRNTNDVADTNLQHGEWRPESLESISTSGKAWAELNGCCNKVADTNSERGCLRKANGENAEDVGQSPACQTGLNWWDIEPNVGRVANGVAARVDRLKAIGNGQVSAVAATAWSILNGT